MIPNDNFIKIVTENLMRIDSLLYPNEVSFGHEVLGSNPDMDFDVKCVEIENRNFYME